MQREKKGKHFIKKPIYPGGPKAIREFIYKHLKYPKEALEAKLEGTVVLKYSINHEGAVTDTTIISGIGKGCDEEASRVAKLLKFQVDKLPGKRTKVLFHNTLKVQFKLPKAQPKSTTVQYQYTTSGKQKPEANDSASGGGSYSYTIEF
ncbi:MAG: TonB family protein [Mameliella sp.]|nr:TonB family protein [Phaeodactylibacter sp.]NRA51005.1 TonB family protein [Phaeodactylibacter sp.]